MEASLEKIALDLFACGAVKFGAFKLKLHEKRPDAPLSPFYLNLRTPEHPTNPGPVHEGIVTRVGHAFDDLAERRCRDYVDICGIPHAGVPLAESMRMSVLRSRSRKHPMPVTLEKKTAPDGSRTVTNATPAYDEDIVRAHHDLANSGRLKNQVLLVDDVITKAESKIEAVDALRAAGYEVTACLVIADRCQGGAVELSEARKVPTHSLFIIHDLIRLYASRGLITHETLDRVTAYLAAGN